MRETDISTFSRDQNFYGEIDLLVTVKNFDLQAIRARYLKSRDEGNKTVGSFKRRPVGNGGILHLSLGEGKVRGENILKELKEPRAISTSDSHIAIGAEDTVYVISEAGITTLKDEWFSYIHTVDFNPENENIILVSSSGFDCFMEYDILTGNKISEWFAWENGLDQGYDVEENRHFTLTRKKDVYEELQRHDEYVKLISDPKNQSLPTAQRAAFINSALYDHANPKSILITLFHEGKVMKVGPAKDQNEDLFTGLRSPHGGRSCSVGYMVTDTAGGAIEFRGNQHLRVLTDNLPFKPKILDNLEWLQNSIEIGGNIVTIDSNRTSFLIFNLELELYDLIPYNNQWALQDLVHLEPTQTGLIHNIEDIKSD